MPTLFFSICLLLMCNNSLLSNGHKYNYDEDHYVDSLYDGMHETEETMISWLKSQIDIDVDNLNLLAEEVGKSAPDRRSLRCDIDVVNMFRDITAGKPYAIYMLDAIAKLPAGFLEGNLQWLGSYGECTQADPQAAGRRFKSRYCLTQINIPLLEARPRLGGLNFGVCLPDSCDPEDVEGYMNMLLSVVNNFLIPDNGTDLTMLRVDCTGHRPLTQEAIATLIVFGILFAFSCAGTTYDYIKRHRKSGSKGTTGRLTAEENAAHEYDVIELTKMSLENDMISDKGRSDGSLSNVSHVQIVSNSQESTVPEEKTSNKIASGLGQILLCFSWITNGEKLLNPTIANEELYAINGIGVMTMGWITIGHFYSTVKFENWFASIRLTKEVFFQPFINGTFPLDAWFMLCGFVVAYFAMKKLTIRNGKLNWIFYIAQRYWRMTPLVMLCVLFWTTLWAYIPGGPLSLPNPSTNPRCEQYWWANLLYINNFVPKFKSVLDELPCFEWGWYVADIMQFFIISPLFLYLLYRWWKLGVLVTLSTIFASIIATGITARNNNVQFAFISRPLPDGVWIYTRPCFRISSYLIGILTGYLFYRVRGKFHMHWLLCLFGWCVALTLNGCVVFGLIGYFTVLEPMDLDVSALYIALSRPAFALSVAWITFACVTGYGGPIASFLSWRPWSVMGRLNLTVYLTGVMVMMAVHQSAQRPIYNITINMAYYFLGHMAITYVVSFFVTLLIESPVIRLEKLIFYKHGKKADTVEFTDTKM